MTSAPSGERTAPGGARATRPRSVPETPAGIKVYAGILAVGSVVDAAVGLLAIEAIAVLGVVLLGSAVAELYLAYGCYHLQRWAYRGTIAVSVTLLAVLFVLGQHGPALLKVALVGYLLAQRDAGWY